MTALQVIEKDVLSDTLASIADVVTIVGTKIFWEHADADEELPYIVISNMMGGRDQDNSYSDSTWKIVGVTGSIITAQALANAISQLDHLDPVTSAYTGVCAYIYIEEKLNVFDRFQIQNTPIFNVGGFYRIRLNLGDN
jgi:hypothetical protein